MRLAKTSKVKVFITIDTEEDCWGDYRARENPVENILSIPKLQELFDRYGAVPTYLINYPVAMSELATDVIRPLLETSRCEIAAHIHPWNTPPFKEEINERNSFICNLPQDLNREKLRILHDSITERFGTTAVCFRAGRWALSEGVARCIQEFGYLVDTSVTPYVDWTAKQGPDFTEASSFPYRFDPEDIFTEKPHGCLLELPPTIGFYQKHMKVASHVRKKILNGRLAKLHLIGILDRLMLNNFRWLSPELSSGKAMVLLAKNFLWLGHPHLNMCFHSPSLLPGKSPFVRNEEDLRNFFRDIETFLEFCVKQGLAFAPLREALELV
jgi:hypothetical protein